MYMSGNYIYKLYKIQLTMKEFIKNTPKPRSWPHWKDSITRNLGISSIVSVNANFEIQMFILEYVLSVGLLNVTHGAV